MRSTFAIVAGVALSTAAFAQVGTDPIDNKVPANQAPATTIPPSDSSQPPVSPPTDDAVPADRADVPANITPAPGDPRDATSPPPKSTPR